MYLFWKLQSALSLTTLTSFAEFVCLRILHPGTKTGHLYILICKLTAHLLKKFQINSTIQIEKLTILVLEIIKKKNENNYEIMQNISNM